MIRRRRQPRFIAALIIVVLSLPMGRGAFAQDLNDEIDAELDASKSVGSTSQAAPAATSTEPSLDDVDLDLGDGPETATKSASESPQAPPDDLDLNDPTLEEPQPVVEKPDSNEEPQVDAKADLKPEAKPEEKSDEKPQVKAETKPQTEPLLDPGAAPDVSMDPVVEQPVQTEKPKQTASAASSLFDPPNEKYEKKLHDISRNYNPVEDPHWDEIIGERRAEIYPAQPGDTLWDISETFFGDGAFWAKLWSQNGAIGNPHNIKKGKALRFAAGTEAEAPAIGVMDLNGAANSSGGLYHESFGERPTYRDEVEGQVTQAEIEGGVVLETQEIIPAPELPPPSKRVPLLKNLPKSFRENHPAYLEGFDLTGIKGAPAIRARVPATQILNSYAVDEKPESIGKIDEIETQDDFASNGQHVLVRLENPIAMGSRLTFIKLRGRPSGAPGPIVDVLGVGTVTGSIDESRHVYRAVVTTSLAPVEKGALILDEAPPKVKVSFVGPRSESRVTVLGGEFDNGRQILGMGSIIYLNGGQKAGLRVGDILGVHSMRENRKRSTRYGDDEKPIATIRIADVREKVATAIILDSFDTVVVGDITGGETPEDASELRAESVEEATAFGKPKAKPSDRGSDAL